MSYLPPGHAPLKFHPFANMLPPLSPERREALIVDILAKGLRRPILLHEDMVLDGRARYEIMRALYRPIKFRKFAKGEIHALRLVSFANFQRLSAPQRKLLIERYAELLALPSVESLPADRRELLSRIEQKYGVAA